MAMQFKSGFCKLCDAQRKVGRKGTNHILHLILSLVTLGLWVVVWFMASVKFGGWRCETCGSSKVQSVR